MKTIILVCIHHYHIIFIACLINNPLYNIINVYTLTHTSTCLSEGDFLQYWVYDQYLCFRSWFDIL